MENLFLSNYTEETFLDRIQNDLRKCKAYYMSVSFIKKPGLNLLIKDISAALDRGCHGKIITSTYQNFTDIQSLNTFHEWSIKYPNFECHLDDECFHDHQYITLGFHTKGYIFIFDDYVEIIVGSSNITRFALLKNIEWDLVLQENQNGPVYTKIKKEFDALYNNTIPLSDSLIHQYEIKLNYAIERWDMDYDVVKSEIRPNYMQKNALKELNRYRAMGIQRAITICSAGSGKTYLSAFDALNFNPKRLLYIVHESSILKKALDTYVQVFGNSRTYGLFTSENKDIDADFLFSTNVSMMKNLALFDENEFDYIVIDECHHAVANSYKKIIDYFHPEFLLGLTATPERMDNQDVLSLFDKNVPYELRLRDAIMNNLVVPFHYYGIRDSLIDYGLPKGQERKMLAQLADDTHCGFVCEQIEKYRQSGKLKALVFCRNQTHARMMAEAFQEHHYNATYLTGKNTVGERIRAYDDLQNDSKPLEILCSVDILNEGVDIPGVNMVIFLRPTDSSTVFIQQLGRGLRTYPNKEFVTVLDFIGNSYKRSVQIAFALGSLSENLVLEKNLLMQMVKDDFTALGLDSYGVQIHLDKESQEEIIHYLENENFNQKQYLKQDYFNFKKYVDAQFYPKHMDYLNNDCAPDLLRFFNCKHDGRKCGCYYNFLKEIEEENLPTFDEKQVTFLQYLSGLLPLVRPYEYQVTLLLLEHPYSKKELHSALTYCDLPTFEHVLHFMEEEGGICWNGFTYSLNVDLNPELEEHIKDLLTFGLTQYEANYQDIHDIFKPYENYRMDQVQRRLLKNPKSNQKGTYIYGKQVVIFASLNKSLSVEERLNYKDRFLSSSIFQWESMNNVSQKEVQSLIDSDFAYLFIRKVITKDSMVLPFTYVGKGKLTNPRYQEKNKSYLFDIQMENELPEYLQYDFEVHPQS